MRFIPTLELDLITRLAPLRATGILVRALPDTPADYGEPTNGEVIVRVNRTTGSAPDSLGSSRANAEVECSLYIRLRNLRQGEAGAWTVLGNLTDYLIGYIPQGAVAKMWLRSAELLDFEQGWWVFEVKLAVPVKMLEETDLNRINDAIFTSFEFSGDTVNEEDVSEVVIYPEA